MQPGPLGTDAVSIGLVLIESFSHDLQTGDTGRTCVHRAVPLPIGERALLCFRSGGRQMGGQKETSLIVTEDGSVKLIVAGEIDVPVAHELAAVLEKACTAQPPELFIALAAVSFCD